MDGKLVVITGGNSGIGKATAEGLAALGARVWITARDPRRGAEAVAGIRAASDNDDVDQLRLDLASLDSIRHFAAELHERTDRLDVLVNNAGVVMRRRAETVDGFEMTFGVNHLGHFLLTDLVLDLLRAAAPSRIVVVASDAHKFARGGLDFDDLQHERGYGVMGMKVYGRSKLANILYTRELARRLDGTGVTVNAVHPGAVNTHLARDGDGGRFGELAMRLGGRFMRTPAEGAATSIHVASAPGLEGVTGGYFADSAPARATAAASDDAAAAKLWSLSEELLARG